MIVILRPPPTPTPRKLADAELEFDDRDGLLNGLVLRGFEIWEAPDGERQLVVTLPTRHFTGRDGVRRAYPLLYSRRRQPDATQRLRRQLAAQYAVEHAQRSRHH